MSGIPVPESLLKKQKRDQVWADQKAKEEQEKAAELEQLKQAYTERAKQYAQEYIDEERAVIDAKREARKNGGFYIPGEPKLMFVIRIKGINKMHPKSRKILQLLRLRQINMGVFLRVNKAILKMLTLVEPYITYGYPNLKSVRELIYKRGYGKIQGNRIRLMNNELIRGKLGKYKIECVEDLIHEIYTVGPHFKQANNFLWPFKLRSAKGGMSKKRNHFVEGGQAGNREELINRVVKNML
eukprot:TRINITY_DN59102_c0_g1_i2.p1 TRINITY_DN59102_c0_g1~~TRINITY_DN59102_c0_g1_i2.p1  ORF type:complete len:263 (-),score=30.03 TRINITY_DN59102_c0_g1_i2:151-873(-)